MWCWSKMFYYVRMCLVSFSSYAHCKHLQGEEAKNIPGESMTEEHYMDHDGNLVSRKVMYTLICSGNNELLQGGAPVLL